MVNYLERNTNKVVMLTLLVSLLLTSCEKSNDSDSVPEKLSIQNVFVELSTHFAVEGNRKPVDIKVSATNNIGKEVSSDQLSQFGYEVLVNSISIGQESKFLASEPGDYTIRAKIGDVLSDETNLKVRESIEVEPLTFQVVFHIIHDGEEVGKGFNLSNADIQYQMSLLKATFEEYNSLTPNSYDPKMKFILATTDPIGNILEEAGVERIKRPDKQHSVLFEDWLWDYYWDPDYYINVWVGDTKVEQSFGIYPKVTCQMEIIPPGIFCSDDDVPSELVGIALEVNNLWEGNWVFPHEIGHVFGLYHVFSDTPDCNVEADFCQDTHQYNREQYVNSATAATSRVSCDGINYTSYNVMDYWSQPGGDRDLTYDQVERMREIIHNSRWIGTKSLNDGSPRNMKDVRSGG